MTVGTLKGEVMDDKTVTIKSSEFNRMMDLIPHECSTCKYEITSDKCNDMYFTGYCKNWCWGYSSAD